MQGLRFLPRKSYGMRNQENVQVFLISGGRDCVLSFRRKMYAIDVTNLRKLYGLNTICIFSSYKREFSISFFKRL